MDELLIVNLADAPAISHPRRATIIDFEPEDAPWPDTAARVSRAGAAARDREL
jgi:hypothetical protein